MRRSFLLSLFFCFFITLSYSQEWENRWVNIVYIGNSITQGVQIENPNRNAPPVKASIYLHKQPQIGEVKYSNQGVSGMTTVDFLPNTATRFESVKEAAEHFKKDDWATLVFSIMLGTNDSAIKGPNGAPVSPEQYYANMKIIMDELLKLYPECIIVLHNPIWYSPNTHNAALYLQEGLNRLQSYFPQLDALVSDYSQTHPEKVFRGDVDAFHFFHENYETYLIPENGNAGIFFLHPNKEGAACLGEFWGKAIYNVLQQRSISTK